jgi:hypothetical protein
MPFTVRADGKPSPCHWLNVSLMVTAEPGLTVPLDSLGVRPGGAETLNEIGPLAALSVNEPVKKPKPAADIGTVPGDAPRTGRGGAGFGLGLAGGRAPGGADFTGAGDSVGWARPGADNFGTGADDPRAGVTAPGGAEIGRAGSGLGRPGCAKSPGAPGTENCAAVP